MHSNYWSCSAFADWIRGTKKPFALGWDEWDEWKVEAQKVHPFRFWVADVALNKLQDILFSPRTLWRACDNYFHNRFIDRSHLIDTGLAPGHYYEFEDKVLHGLFHELVDFVEIEESLNHRAWNDGPRKPRRMAEWGIKHLEWEMALVWDEDSGTAKDDEHYGKPTHQAIAALETFRLYEWWTKTRPNRPDPHDIFTEEDHEKMMAFDGTLDHKFEHLRKVEEQYDREDNAYLVRLVLHRKCLWT